jgi:hypothetical protein
MNDLFYRELFMRVSDLHALDVKEILLAEAVDLREFLRYTQRILNQVRELNNHPIISRLFSPDGAASDYERLQGVIVEMIHEGDRTPNNDTSASAQVLAKLLVLVAPETQGVTGVSKWLTDLKYDPSKANSVYKKFSDIKAWDRQEANMASSVEHLEKMKRLVTDVHPQFKKHLPQIELYLKKARSTR